MVVPTVVCVFRSVLIEWFLGQASLTMYEVVLLVLQVGWALKGSENFEYRD